jgi:hypothetical protein
MTDTRVADRYEPLEVVGRGGEATVVRRSIRVMSGWWR